MFINQKVVKDSSQRKHIACGFEIDRLREHEDLGGYIARGAAVEEQVLRRIDIVSKAEIGNYRLCSIAPDNDVLRFYISMHHSVYDQKGYSFQ